MDKKGFTLIEIIILIVMAGILLPAIIVPFVTGVRGSGKPELVTTAMYRRHGGGKAWQAILIGYFGSIGIATISDAIIPYLGGVLLHIQIEFHIPFIEEWYLVNPLALAGIAIGYLRPDTKLPHFGHILVSTWATLFYFAGFGVANWLQFLFFVFLFLFIAVWLPCCTSDIVFPLLFVGRLDTPEHTTYNHNHSEGEENEATHHNSH